jgi:hypothetical protein
MAWRKVEGTIWLTLLSPCEGPHEGPARQFLGTVTAQLSAEPCDAVSTDLSCIIALGGRIN